MEVGTETQQPNYDRSIDDNNDDDVNGSKSSKKEHRSIGYFELFSYATPCEYIYLLIATLAAILRSSAFPLVIVIYSEMIAMFIDRSLGTTTKTYFLPLFDGGKILFNATHEENMMELKNDAKAFGILSGLNTLSLFLMGIIYVDLYNYVALNILVRLRCKYYQHVIRQDISWHDTIDQQNFASIITDNMEKIRNGISETIGHFIQLLFDIIISIVISFVYGWRLTLTVCAYIPITMIVNYVVSKYQTKLTASEQSAYSKASSVAEEVLAAIRTVIAFGGEKHERQRYNELLVPARKAGKLKGIFSGLNDSLLKAMLFLCSAATFWHGVHLVLNDRDKDPNDKEYTPEILMIVICGIIVGAQHISYTAPFLEGFAIAKGSAIPIYNVLESRSKIDPLSSHGKILNYGLKGDIEFQDVFFHYPSRPNSIVLRGFNLKVKSGETVALVGTSGSGKSTCIQLLLRFYDPIFGKILIDDEDLRKYNVNWLRSNVAVVGQEPVLFFGTIEENIRYGKMDATQKEIEDAAKIAGAHDFIISLPESYKTSISEKGIQLSGGQRQRIAIARALIQNPKILLLDEATSALDYQSEKLIQNALDNASKGRTTIVISHRLSAICQAHRIIFIENGKIVEEGDHETLMLQKGHYYNMVATQEYEGTLRDNNTENFDLNIYNEVDVKKCDFNSVLEEQWEESKIYVGLKNNFIENELHNTKANKLDKAETEEDTTKFMRTFLRVLKWSKPEWGYLIIGTVCAALYGCTQPVFAIILAELFGSLSEKEPDEVLRQSTKTSIISTIVGVVAGITCLAQTYFFNLAGVWLTTRMRSAAFKKILKQDMAWFDEKENSVGALSARLAGDACGVQGAIGFPLSNILQALFNLICSFSIGFAYSWELALICLSTAPFMVAAILFEAKFNNKSALEEKRILEETSRIATESIAQIRTVAALRRETELIKLYKMEVMKYYRQIKGRLRFRGLVSSLGLSIMFFGYSITLTYGGYMSANGRIEFKEIIKISNSLLYGLFILAQSLAFTPAFNAALLSANRLFNIIDRKPQILSPNLKITTDFKQPRHQNNNNLTHAVDYRNIKFQYPTRPGQKVLNGFNLAIMQGKTVGLVGASGSGKSTCIQLLLRYYDPDSGQILIDNENIQLDMSLDNLRQRFGIVAQEPSLFENTIAENIAYGDNSRPVPMDEIIKAAKIANAHDFIINLPKAYETCLGARGTQLSGGQKQRIAIARALIRNPKILLLDEATSALDIQSENIVQKALDEACSGRTCLIIAHRLSTIQNADLICVIKNGHIVEQGNHTHLLNRNGIYAKLYRSQPNALTTTTKTTPPLPTSRIL